MCWDCVSTTFASIAMMAAESVVYDHDSDNNDYYYDYYGDYYGDDDDDDYH